MSNRSFQKSECAIALFKRTMKRAIALSLFQKERWKERSLICSFKKSERAKMSEKWVIFQIAHFSIKKRAIAHFQSEQMVNPGCRVGQSLIRSFAHRSFPLLSKERLSNRSLNCSFKKSNWAIALFSLFSKEQQKERSLFCSFKKSDEKSDRSFALSKRAKEQKWAIAHFQNERMPNPAKMKKITETKVVFGAFSTG